MWMQKNRTIFMVRVVFDEGSNRTQQVYAYLRLMLFTLVPSLILLSPSTSKAIGLCKWSIRNDLCAIQDLQYTFTRDFWSVSPPLSKFGLEMGCQSVPGSNMVLNRITSINI
ncbi:hypothetical protein BOTNAR_0009g00530 [Botryotinia narcissicola]|uniref:Uncharacterized protein n=1 Tax=Botryotinia narcissicola TaxID=278944 RepID=A0A4Z1J7N0_9HELO|nr:hypothetical protein BOTNAR_0009g00530 [Botryotinia narcissicola]